MAKRDLFHNNIPTSSVFARRVIGGSYNQFVMNVRGSWKDMRDKYIEISPWFQRGEVWTLQQKRDLIDTMFSGLTIPPLYIRQMPTSYQYQYQMVDGKQRFLTIMGYIDNEFSYVAADGREWFFRDLTDTDRNIFMSCMVSFVELLHSTDEEIVKIYNRINFNGTPHTEDQRADLAKCPDPITEYPQERTWPSEFDRVRQRKGR